MLRLRHEGCWTQGSRGDSDTLWNVRTRMAGNFTSSSKYKAVSLRCSSMTGLRAMSRHERGIVTSVQAVSVTADSSAGASPKIHCSPHVLPFLQLVLDLIPPLCFVTATTPTPGERAVWKSRIMRDARSLVAGCPDWRLCFLEEIKCTCHPHLVTQSTALGACDLTWPNDANTV